MVIMLEETNELSTTENVGGRYDLSGRKLAYIFSWGSQSERLIDPNKKDVDKMVGVLKHLGFEFDKELLGLEDEDDSCDDSSDSYCDSYKEISSKEFAIRNMKPLDLIELISWITSRVGDASCIFMYFIIRQDWNSLIEEYDRHIPIFSVWKKFKKIKCPKLFFIQANITKEGYMHSALMNTEAARKPSSIPGSANVLLAYFPNFSGAAKSVAEILEEELYKPYDINKILTTVIDRVNTKGRSPNPKFSSTLLKQLYLTNELNDPNIDLLPLYNISEGKRCLAYVFLFGKFEMCSSLMNLVELDIAQLTNTFNRMGFNFNFCVEDGHMTVKQFLAKLKEILQDKNNMEMCECIMIFISSHGEEDGVIHASNGLISRDIVVTELSSCKALEGKPKLVLIDACRGSRFDRPLNDSTSSTPSGSLKEHNPATMCSSMRYHAVYDSNMWRLTCYETPEMSDVMLVMSSTEGRVSIFRIDSGSLFLKNLSEKLTEHGKDYDFMTVLNLTMCTVAQLTLPYQGDELKQQITFTSSLRKLLIFPK